MTQTFADQLFQNLDSLKDNSYKLSNDKIKLEANITNIETNNINLTVYGLDYELGTNSSYTVGTKIADMTLNMTDFKKTTETTTNINLDMVNKKVNGVVDGYYANFTELDENIEGVSGTFFEENITIQYNIGSDTYKDIMTISTDNKIKILQDYLYLPKSYDDIKNYYKLFKIVATTQPTSYANGDITVKTTDGDILWKFTITKFNDERGYSFGYSDQRGYNILPTFKNITTKKHYTYINDYRVYNHYPYDRMKIEIISKDANITTIEYNPNFLNYEIKYSNDSLKIYVEGKVIENGQAYCYITVGDDSFYIIILNNGEYSVNKIHGLATITNSDNNKIENINLYPISKTYPALFIISNDIVKNDEYINKRSELINNIITDSLSDGVIYTYTKYEINN